jgi:imidazolonepropionase-like amidohydrolase
VAKTTVVVGPSSRRALTKRSALTLPASIRTLRGAEALLMETAVGSIEPGQRADLVLYDLDVPSGSRS